MVGTLLVVCQCRIVQVSFNCGSVALTTACWFIMLQLLQATMCEHAVAPTYQPTCTHMDLKFI